MVYLISGICAGIAGVFYAATYTAILPGSGSGIETNAIAATVIGGTSMSGGKGGITGTVLGTILLRILASGLSLMGIPSTWQKALIGVIIVALIVADVVNERRKNIKGMRRVYGHVA